MTTPHPDSLPSLSGIHHLSVPVTDLEDSLQWYQNALNATRIERFDHHDDDGAIFAAILQLPGDAPLLELRRDIEAAHGADGYTPIVFGVGDRAGLDRWVQHFDAAQVRHSVITPRRVGECVDVSSPDGLVLRFYTDPIGGFAQVRFDEKSRKTVHGQSAS